MLVTFCWLGNWQLQRRAWKLELIEHVGQQLERAPIAAPGPDSWSRLSSKNAYLPVQLNGRFLHQKEVLVQAMTAYGSGYWVLTPFTTESGFTVLINRGFVDSAHKEIESRSPINVEQGSVHQRSVERGNVQQESVQQAQSIQVTGLLRLTEPDGRLLQKNQPLADRWYSRDVQAIGKRLTLAPERLAPYFIDAKSEVVVGKGALFNSRLLDAPVKTQVWPIAGLTVVSFRNMHLAYAITWFSLALLCLVAAVLVIRFGHHRHR